MSFTAKSLFAASLAALLWVAYGVAGDFVPWLPGAGDGSRPADSGTGPEEPSRGPVEYDIDRIVDAHVFGQTSGPEVVDANNAPETKLQITLAGLMASSNDGLARAMVSVNSGRVNIYRVGQQIDDTDAEVYSINPSRILIKRGDELESVVMRVDKVSLTASNEDMRGVFTETGGNANPRAPASKRPDQKSRLPF